MDGGVIRKGLSVKALNDVREECMQILRNEFSRQKEEWRQRSIAAVS